MKVEFDKSFYKRLIKIKDPALLEKVRNVILHAEVANDIQHIQNIRKMEGFKTFNRIRVGDYRIGLELKKDTLWFITSPTEKRFIKNFRDDLSKSGYRK